MSRKSLPKAIANEFDITEFVKQFYEKNEGLKKLKKDVDNDKVIIKDYCFSHKTDKIIADDIKCTVTKSEKSTLLHDLCKQILDNLVNTSELSKDEYDKIVKYKPYIDEDALENAIHSKIIDGSRLHNCIETNYIYTCKVSKIK